MEEEQSSKLELKSKLNTVTPFSKYLALVLFVAMPFIGGWIGYMYAPEKIVEVERIVLQEVEINRIEEEETSKQTAESYKFMYEPTPVVLPDVPSPHFSLRPHVSPDGNYVAWSYSNEGGDTRIYITDSDENKLTETYCGSFSTWSEDGSRVEVYVPIECGLPPSVASTSFYLTTQGSVVF